MKNHYHRLRFDEMKERGIYGHSCGYAINPLIKVTSEVRIKQECSLTGERCIYSGRRFEPNTDWHSCPVYLKFERKWQNESKLISITEEKR